MSDTDGGASLAPGHLCCMHDYFRLFPLVYADPFILSN